MSRSTDLQHVPTWYVRGHQTTWFMWWGGTLLIVGSWVDLVSWTMGWVGFGTAVASSIIGVILNKAWRMPTRQSMAEASMYRTADASRDGGELSVAPPESRE